VAASRTPLVMVLDSQTQTISLILQDQRGTQLFLAPDSGSSQSHWSQYGGQTETDETSVCLA
jgi:hypothetical protein